MLEGRFVDAEAIVRTAACAVFRAAELETVLHRIDPALLRVLAERILDKRVSLDAVTEH